MDRRTVVRSLLATGATAGLAGCNVFLGAQGDDEDTNTKKIFLVNQNDRAVDLELTIADAESGDKAYDETIRVPEDDPPTQRVTLQPATYELTANVVDGPRGTYRWGVSPGPDSGLSIILSAEEIEISEWAE